MQRRTHRALFAAQRGEGASGERALGTTVAAAYLVALAGLLVSESQDPSPALPLFFLPSVLVGVVIGRFWALALPVAAVTVLGAFSELLPSGDTGPAAALAGICAGIVLRAVWHTASRAHR